MGGEDQDAMWRPGYTGGYGPPDDVSVTSGSTTRRARLGLATAVIVALVAGATAFVIARSTAPEPLDPPGALRLPDGATERWSVRVEGLAITIVAGSERLVVVADETHDDVVALDGRSGAVRWRTTAPHGPVASLVVIGDVVVGRSGAAGLADPVFRLAAGDGALQVGDPDGSLDGVAVEVGQVLVRATGSPSVADPGHAGGATELADGYVDVVQASPQGARPVVIGYDLDRIERWRMPITGVMDVTLIDRAIVTVEPSIIGVASNVVLAR